MDQLIIVAILVGHFLADFVAQNDWMAINKSRRWDALSLHVGVYGAVFLAPMAISGMVSPAWMVANAVAHFAQDAITSRITSRLWFVRGVKMVPGKIAVAGGAWEIEPSIPVVDYTNTRHWFFVVIGLDQLLRYLTMFMTANI